MYLKKHHSYLKFSQILLNEQHKTKHKPPENVVSYTL